MTDPLSNAFAALADPTRRAILARLASGEASVTELARPFAMTMPAITKHLKVLERAGLITRGRTAQWRPCRLEARGLRDVADWMEYYRRFWEQSLDRLGEYLQDVQQKEQRGQGMGGSTPHPGRTPKSRGSARGSASGQTRRKPARRAEGRG